MNAAIGHLALKADFRPVATFWIAILALLLIVPFTIYSFIEARLDIAASSLSVTIILVVNAWNAGRTHYTPTLTLLTLLPTLAVFHVLSLTHLGVIGLLWCYPAILTLYGMLPERWAWFANIVLLLVIVPTMFWSIDTAVAVRGLVTLIAVSLFPAILVQVISRQHATLHRVAVTDSLTGVLNRLALTPALERTIEQAQLLDTPVSLQIIDLDHFKEINDKHGHDVGDDVLRGVGELLKAQLRQGDSAFRLGGEEFLILLNGAGARDAQRLAESLRIAISDARLLPEGNVTASIGIAVLERAESDWRAWMRRADQALYRAKSEGRNRTVSG